MASLFSKVTTFARSPQGQKVISQATAKAKTLANDPRTRAKIDQGAARVRSEVAKRRAGSAGTGAATPPASAVPPVPPAPPTTPSAGA